MPIQKIPKEDVLLVIEKLGPCQPIDIRKSLKQGDSFLIGAMLSEFVAEGTLGISKVRRGGSPFYYLISRPQTLDQISSYLNEKDRRTYAMLKEHLVLREDMQDPLIRVGLKNMDDFSKPLDVDGVRYWKYFMISDDDAKKIITQNGIDSGTSPLESIDEIGDDADLRSGRRPKDDTSLGSSGVVEKNAQQIIAGASQEAPQNAAAVVAARPKEQEPAKKERKQRRKKEPEKKEQPKTGSNDDSAQQTISKGVSLADDISAAQDQKPADGSSDALKEDDAQNAQKPAPKKRISRKKQAVAQPTVTSDGSVVIAPEAWLAHDTLYEKIVAFASGAPIREQKVIKPNAQISCIMTIDIQFGKIDVMVVAFNKKLVEDELAKAVAVAKDRGLPVLLISVDPFPGKMTSVFKGFPNVMFKQFEQKKL